MSDSGTVGRWDRGTAADPRACSGMASAYSGWAQKGHMYGQSVRSRAAGSALARGVYSFSTCLGDES